MRRFEYSDDRSHKFWGISVQGSDVHVRYGRIGTDGQRKDKAHDSVEAADAAAEKQIAEKLKKGYQEVDAA